MNIVKALQSKDNCLRISCGDRWLCGDGKGGFVVYENKPYARKTTIVCETITETVAVDALIERK